MPARPPLFSSFLLVSTLALCVLVVILTRQNRDLRSEATALRQLKGEAALPLGEMVATLESFAPTRAAGDPSDAPETDALSFADGRLGTLLYLFSSSCSTCEVVMPRIAALSLRHKPSGLELFAIQIDAQSPDQLKDAALGVQVRGVPNAERTWLRRVPLVPSILLLDHEGVLVQGWYGAPDDRQWSHIERELAKLSGVEPK